MSKELFKVLLNYEFYEKAKDRVTEQSFQDRNIQWLFSTVKTAREKGIKDISVQELKVLHESYNPAASNASKRSLDVFYQELENIDISPAVGEELVSAQYRANTYTELAQLAMDAADNKGVTVEKIEEVLGRVREAAKPVEDEFVTTDIDELLNEVEREYKWKIHLPPLAEVISGVGEGVFSIIAARPNAGKTGFLVSLIFQPGGFLDQGAKVVYLANEEKGQRTMVRGISCYTGLPKEQLKGNPQVKEIFSRVRNNIRLKDSFGLDLTELDKRVKLWKETEGLDILFIDQLDKIRVQGAFAGDHDIIRVLYTSIREMAKKYNIVIFAASQANDNAEGKLYYGFECLENSRTGKAAECDICICIGKESFGSNEGNDTGFRVANVVKNKLTGIEKPVGFILNRNISRMSP